jgi:hypothetical protein
VLASTPRAILLVPADLSIVNAVPLRIGDVSIAVE